MLVNVLTFIESSSSSASRATAASTAAAFAARSASVQSFAIASTAHCPFLVPNFLKMYASALGAPPMVHQHHCMREYEHWRAARIHEASREIFNHYTSPQYIEMKRRSLTELDDRLQQVDVRCEVSVLEATDIAGRWTCGCRPEWTQLHTSSKNASSTH